MKKSGFVLAVLPLALVLLSGCVGGTSIEKVTPPFADQVSSAGAPVRANIEVENRGQFLFNCIPLWSGEPTQPNLRKYRTFTNYVKPGYARFMVKNAIRENEDQMIADVETKEHSSGLFTLWILWSRTVRATAVAVDAPVKPEKAEKQESR